MNRLSLIVCSSAIFVSGMALASHTTTIDQIHHTSVNEVLLILATDPPSSAGCSTLAPFDYAISNDPTVSDPVAKAKSEMQLQIALIAYALGKEVIVAGNGNCSVRSDVEDLNWIRSK